MLSTCVNTMTLWPTCQVGHVITVVGLMPRNGLASCGSYGQSSHQVVIELPFLLDFIPKPKLKRNKQLKYYIITKLLPNVTGYLLIILVLVLNTVVPATAGPLGERPPALDGHFCDVPSTNYFAILKYLHPTATCLTRPADSRMLDFIPAKAVNCHGSFQIFGGYCDIF